MSYIYALTDPRSELVRYVGKADDPRFRLSFHLGEIREWKFWTNARKCAWLLELKEEGLIPILIVLEEVTEENWQERERWWIAYYRARGLDLVNLTEGGEGGSIKGRISKEARERMSRFFKGRVISRETRRKISLALSGKKLSKKTRERMSIAAKGKRKSDAHRQKHQGEHNSAAKLTWEKVAAIREEYGKNPKRGMKVKLGRKYRVTPECIGHVICNETWRVR